MLLKLPRVIICSASSLDHGYGRMILKDILAKENNMIIFTDEESMRAGSIANSIMDGDIIVR